MNKKVVIVILSFFFVFPLFAEKIVFKSGKEINEKITQRTDKSVKVEIMGMPVTYYLEDIESIGGEVLGSSVDKSMSWEQFGENANEYTLKFQALMDKSKLMARSQDEKLKKAMEMNDRKQGEKIIAETSNKLAKVAQELKLLKPPPELVIYNKKWIESYENRKMSNDAILNSNIEVAGQYQRKAMVLEMEAMMEMRRVYAEHNGPKEEIEVLNQLINFMEKALKGKPDPSPQN